MKKILLSLLLLAVVAPAWAVFMPYLSLYGSGGTPTEAPFLLTDAYTNEDGDSVDFVFSANITLGADSIDGLTMTTDAVNNVLSNPSVSGNVLTVDVGTTIEHGDTNLSTYVVQGDGIESTDGGVELGAFADDSVTNMVPDSGETEPDPPETFYVRDTANGTETGLSYDNSISETEFNNPNWYTPLVGTPGLISPGDRVYLCGTITGQILLSGDGNSSASITIAGDPAHPAILTYADSSDNGTIRVDGKDYWAIDGENITINDGDVGIRVTNNSDYWTIKGATIYEQSKAGIWADNVTKLTIGGASGDGNTIYNIGNDTGGGDIVISDVADEFVISHNKLYATSTSWGIDGIVIPAYDEVQNGLIEKNIIYGHKLTGEGEDGIDFKGNSHHIIVRHNYFGSNRRTGLQAQKQYDITAPHNLYIYGNYFTGEFGWAGLLIKDEAYSTYAWSNLFADITDGAGTEYDVTCGDNHALYNNSYVNVEGSESNRAGLKIEGTGVDNITIDALNNLFYNCEGSSDRRQAHLDEDWTFENNLGWHDTDGASTKVYESSLKTFSSIGTNNVIDDPELDANYFPGAATDAIGNGQTIAGGPGSVTIMGTTYTPLYSTGLGEGTSFSTSSITVVEETQGASWNIGAKLK